MSPPISTRFRVSDLNDAFRAAGPVAGATWHVTPGVLGLGADFVAMAVRAVRGFEGFTPGNDPYEEHDFGSIKLAGETLFWRIEAYDRELNYGSPKLADPAVTTRVLTLMLASEY
jgi:hypothetical protein